MTRDGVKILEDIKYLIWLASKFSYGSEKPIKILNKFATAKDFYDNIPNSFASFKFLTNKDVERLTDKSLNESEYIISDCFAKSIGIITINNECFPERLKNIYGCPIVLYYKGNLSSFNNPFVISIVGTRNPSSYGRYVTGKLAMDLAKNGVTIVSGCAVGIDSMAHIGALKVGGVTLAVLGCGIDIDYPWQNKDLKTHIVKNGALISELPPGTSVKGSYFPVRNRLIAGLSIGVIVTESPAKSGSLITMDHAIDQNKDCFCVPPHNIYDDRYSGVVRYLLDGAVPIYSVNSILEEYLTCFDGLQISKTNEITQTADYNISENAYATNCNMVSQSLLNYDEKNKANLESDIANSLDGDELTIYKLLQDSNKHIDLLVEQSGISLSKVLGIITQLEILGNIISYGSNIYGLKIK